MVSQMNAPEIGIYPGSDEVGAFGRDPGSPDEGLELYLPQDAEPDYWEGAAAPGIVHGLAWWANPCTDPRASVEGVRDGAGRAGGARSVPS